MSPVEAEEALQRLWRALAPLGGTKPTTAWEEDPGWADAWREWFSPVRAGKRLVVHPPWRAPEAAGLVAVEIEPGMAFGTGGHATTLLALAALERCVDAGAAEVLDVGTGSGVLAVAAVRLGARRAVAIDNDPEALAAARGNVARNSVTGRAEVQEAWPDGQFDLVVANIVSPTLLALRPRLVAAVRPGGSLVLSGVLVEEAEQVQAAFEAEASGLRVTARDRCDADADWVALTLAR